MDLPNGPNPANPKRRITMAEHTNSPIPTPVDTGSILDIRDAVNNALNLVLALSMAVENVGTCAHERSGLAALADVIHEKLRTVDAMLGDLPA
jgi:hypothetical protein